MYSNALQRYVLYGKHTIPKKGDKAEQSDWSDLSDQSD